MASLEHLDPRDREYVESLPPREREVVVTTLARHRRPEQLRVGDDLPAVSLLRLEDGSRAELRALAADRPLCLVFGSFT
jgi:hypothetical protein